MQRREFITLRGGTAIGQPVLLAGVDEVAG